MVEKKKSPEALQSGSGNRSAGCQIPDVVTVRQVAAERAPEGRKVCRMDRDGITRRKGFIKRLIEPRIERFFVMLCHCEFREGATLRTLQKAL
jgi:hypothetical protein